MSIFTPKFCKHLVSGLNLLSSLLADTSPRESQSWAHDAKRIQDSRRRAPKKINLPFASKAERRNKKKLSKKEVSMEKAEIRIVCSARAAGICECGCGQAFNEGYLHSRATLDHFDNGRGKDERQSIENCWMLRWDCHEMRQTYSPNVETWNLKFARHANTYGYPIIKHIEHAQLQSRPARTA